MKPDELDLLLSRPTLSRDARIFHDAWLMLHHDQPLLGLPAGMSGFVIARQKITRAAARAEGIDLGFEGDALLDFVVLMQRIDALEWPEDVARQLKGLAEAQKKNTPPTNK